MKIELKKYWFKGLKKDMSSKKRKCVDCGKDISHLHHNAKRCRNCAKERKKRKDRIRQKKKRLDKLRWHSFIEDPQTGKLKHRNAKGSKIRYWLDKICKKLTTHELNFLLRQWNKRIQIRDLSSTQVHEYKTCAGIIKDWRDYNILNEESDGYSYDSTTGVIFNPDGSYSTIDFDEENNKFIMRDSEGVILN